MNAHDDSRWFELGGQLLATLRALRDVRLAEMGVTPSEVLAPEAQAALWPRLTGAESASVTGRRDESQPRMRVGERSVDIIVDGVPDFSYVTKCRELDVYFNSYETPYVLRRSHQPQFWPTDAAAMWGEDTLDIDLKRLGIRTGGSPVRNVTLVANGQRRQFALNAWSVQRALSRIVRLVELCGGDWHAREAYVDCRCTLIHELAPCLQPYIPAPVLVEEETEPCEEFSLDDDGACYLIPEWDGWERLSTKTLGRVRLHCVSPSGIDCMREYVPAKVLGEGLSELRLVGSWVVYRGSNDTAELGSGPAIVLEQDALSVMLPGDADAKRATSTVVVRLHEDGRHDLFVPLDYPRLPVLSALQHLVARCGGRWTGTAEEMLAGDFTDCILASA